MRSVTESRTSAAVARPGHAGLTDVVLAVADARPDPATHRFDTELARAVASGRLDEVTARTLRWWQRESVRGMRSYLGHVLPSILATLDAAADDGATSVAAAAAAWTHARTGPAHGSAASLATLPPVRSPEPVPDDAQTPAAVSTTRSTAPGTTTRVHRPVDVTDRRRREVVAGLIAAEGPGGYGPNADREGHR